ncbi:MAG: methyltransferase domain-containing protein [Solirubrobacteraceae bacterium]
MAQPLIRAFVAELAARIELPDPVVEFGSLQVEAHQDGDLRPLFPGRDYGGTDFREGPGVDRVEDLRGLSFGDGAVGTALCLDTLEHCEDPPQACRELARVTRGDGGVCVISSVMLFGIHGYPGDFFRFTPEGFCSLLGGFDAAWVGAVGHPDIPTQVIGVGAHGRPLDLRFADFPCLIEAQRHYDDRRGKVRLGVHNYSPVEVARALRSELPRLVRERLRRWA